MPDFAFLQDLSRVEAAAEALCKNFHPDAFSNVDSVWALHPRHSFPVTIPFTELPDAVLGRAIQICNQKWLVLYLQVRSVGGNLWKYCWCDYEGGGWWGKIRRNRETITISISFHYNTNVFYFIAATERGSNILLSDKYLTALLKHKFSFG